MLRLGDIAAQSGYRLRHVETVDSTNARLVQEALNGEKGGLWLVSDEQTGGRGRRGRHWCSRKGNLYSSLLLSTSVPLEKVAQLSFVAALALYDAVVAVNKDPGNGIALKWPNDLMINGRKCAGLLLEGGTYRTSTFVVIGIGVNIVSHPVKTRYPASDLAAQGIATSVGDFFAYLSNAVVQRIVLWSDGRKFSEIRRDWLQNAWRTGEQMRINTGTECFVARFDGLDTNGNLLVEHQGRLRKITAGEVFPLNLK